MVETSDFNDTLGAGSYPEPPEEKEKKITGKIVITYDLDAVAPSKWDKETIVADIKENLDDYIYLKDYEDIDVDFYGVEEFD